MADQAALAEIEKRIQVVEDNLRQLVEQAAAYSGAADEERNADRIAGFLCAFSFALSGIAIARTPGVLATAAVIVALVAARMTQTRRTLAAVAVGVAGAAFVLGMTVAVLTDGGIY